MHWSKNDKRVRPKAMTACVINAGLLPILWSHGAGANVMKRIATPMIGGVITSTVMELAVYPAIFSCCVHVASSLHQPRQLRLP